MGIELPAELSEVAAKAGVQWPKADEDAMRTSATAWRDAGDKIGRLGTDTDGSAGRAMDAMTGATGDAARSHWSKIVAPDGQFQQAARGCRAAADRLDHAADQVGAAKAEIVRELVTLAKNQDAAGQAANAGHPTALLGLDTAVRGAAANVANLSNTLNSAIRLDSGVDMGHAQPPVNTSPGAHGGPSGLLSPVTDAVSGVVAPVAGAVAPVVGAVAPVVAPVAEAVAPVVAPVAGAAAPIVAPVAGAVAPVVAPVADAVAPVADAVAPVTQPVLDAVPGAQPVLDNVTGRQDAAAPPGHQEGLVPGLVDAAQPVVPPVAQVVDQVVPGVSAQVPMESVSGVLPVAEGTTQTSAATLLDRPAFPAETAAPQQQAQAAAQQAAAQTPAAPAMGNAPATPAAPMAPTPGAAAGGVIGQAQGGGAAAQQGAQQQQAAQRTPEQAQQKPAEKAPDKAPEQKQGQQQTTAAAKADAKAVVAQDVSGSLPTQLPGGAATTMDTERSSAVVPSAAVQHVQAAAALGTWFLAVMYPLGQGPRISRSPARQLPPPAEEADYAAGERFEPQDHPRSELVDTAFAHRPEQSQGLPAEHPAVQALLDGYDPLGGAHEHEWEHRFVVREEPVEYAWPPAEMFPEGGYEASQPDVLEEGAGLDRFGSPEGRVLSESGTPFAQRSLPPHALHEGYHRYKVLRTLPVWRTVSAPWFGQPGGGARYRTTYPVADLVALGYLMEITA